MNAYPTRMQAVQSPIIPAIAAMIQQHPGTLSLGQGVVYYGPPPDAIAQITSFLANPEHHKYGAVEGMAPLLEQIALKLKTENGIAVDDEHSRIVVTAGSNMGFLNAVLAITSPGDEIILQTPYYFNHEMAVTIAGCRSVLVATDDQYQLRPDAIQQAITDRTRAIVTISPNNPTGVVYPAAALQQVNDLCRDRGIYHIHDEAYEYFTYDGAQAFSPGSLPGSSRHTISLYSLSKAYGFASWRIGYMVIPANLMTAVMKIQDTNVICPAVISQYAARGALQVGVSYCHEKLVTIATVRQQLLSALGTLGDRCTLPPSDGAFYFFLKVHTHLTALELVERLIRDHKIAVIPGTTFGLDDGCYLRVAYGALQTDAIVAIDRLVHGLKAVLE